MSGRRKVIIDTDPGVDDVLALLLALSSPELEVLAITTVHGNIDLSNTTRNTISLLKVLEAASKASETTWAKSLFTGHERIVLAAGAKAPLVPEKQLDAAYFHGADGLGNVSTVYPQYLPTSGWQDSFPSLRQDGGEELDRDKYDKTQFPGLWASPLPAHQEILRILEREGSGSVSLVVLGPMTNISLACQADYETLSKVREVVVMGGALTVPGNVTPKSEFNFLADPESASLVLSYTSPTPSSTHPTSPDSVGKRLSVSLLPLDTTTTVCLSHPAWFGIDEEKKPGLLKSWCNVFMKRTFETMSGLYLDSNIEKVNLSMHDPACIWYLLSQPVSNSNDDTDSSTQTITAGDGWIVRKNVDVRVEYTGTWTRGCCVIDERGRQRVEEALEDVDKISAGSDTGTWLDPKQGNRVTWVTRTPGSAAFAQLFMSRVFHD